MEHKNFGFYPEMEGTIGKLFDLFEEKQVYVEERHLGEKVCIVVTREEATL